jgi:hypothetical protein
MVFYHPGPYLLPNLIELQWVPSDNIFSIEAIRLISPKLSSLTLHGSSSSVTAEHCRETLEVLHIVGPFRSPRVNLAKNGRAISSVFNGNFPFKSLKCISIDDGSVALDQRVLRTLSLSPHLTSVSFGSSENVLDKTISPFSKPYLTSFQSLLRLHLHGAWKIIKL